MAEQFTARDAFGAQARDELGITEAQAGRPTQAAAASTVTFAVGLAVALLLAAVVPAHVVIATVAVGSLACLAMLGAVAAHEAGASGLRGAVPLTCCRALALAATVFVRRLFGRTA